ncbi:MAG TPA: hypothetical protein VE954_21030 [Oligoflexus sp.]|uniref:hypothetical protein n=1 Tax=Oligoflexus sp. TaxID=1971216 RepID=UPI002D560A1C|nr:hypothetical protein [Oligoflexus sp.]HYX35589.1 hypothetical protein [Oligoflexus sp.]
MRSLHFFAFIDFFISRPRLPKSRDELIKARIFVLGALLLALISIMDIVRLALRDVSAGYVSEALNLSFATLSLICHYRFGRPQYFILPCALGLVLLLAFNVIIPAHSLLAPSIQWLPLIAGIVFFVSGRWWGSSFAFLMILTTVWLHRNHLALPVKLPADQTLSQFVSDMPITLFQVLAVVSIMVLAYIQLHREARMELMNVQSQVAQALRSAENSDFSQNIRSRIDQQLRPIKSYIGIGRSLTSDEYLEQLQKLTTVLAEMRDYTLLQRSVQETDNADPVSLITWDECVRRIRSLFSGCHGLLSIRYEDHFETAPACPLDSRLVLVLLEGLRLLCYQTQARGFALLQLNTYALNHEFALVLNLTLENASPIDADEKILNEQKLELTMGILKQSLKKQGGSLQTRKQDQSFWLQIALPLPSRTAA